MSQIYDTAIVLGSRPLGPSDWGLPQHVYASLDRAANLYAEGKVRFITLSGKWTINFDILNIEQPFKECDAMADYLLMKNVPVKVILKEAESIDTISNLYYLKRQILIPNNFKKLLFIAGNTRLNRIEYLSKKILGPEYECSFEGVAILPSETSNNEAFTFKVQSEFLETMKDGDDSWLDDKFYDAPFYEAIRTRVKTTAADEPFIRLAR